MVKVVLEDHLLLLFSHLFFFLWEIIIGVLGQSLVIHSL